MINKVKLTLWIDKNIKQYGKKWAQEHHTSMSQIVADYFRRLKQIDKKDFEPTPIVKELTGVVSDKSLSKEDYKKHIKKKYAK